MTDIRRVDLNLLVALDVLLEERNVSRAAERLALTQPTVSGMLRRLRDLFGDELLVRTQRGMLRGWRIADSQKGPGAQLSLFHYPPSAIRHPLHHLITSSPHHPRSTLIFTAEISPSKELQLDPLLTRF